MNHTLIKKHLSLHSTVLLALLALLFTACSTDDDFVPPSFLHVDAIKLVPTTSNPISVDPGFYTSDIVACYVVAHYPNSSKLDSIGLFQLPFTVPVLYSGEVDYFEFYPAVKQSGISGTLPYYTFYNPIRVNSQTLTTGDTLRLDTLTTTYAISLSDMQMFEPFEPTELSTLFDSITWHKYAAAEACTGQGYASVHVPDSISNVPFAIKTDFYVADPTRAVYLELDSRSDLRFEVYMESAYTSGGATDKQRVMVVYPSDHWQHLYINLGRTWSWFNHNPSFKLSFAALNPYGEEGDIRIDNVKLITTASVL
ncbi:MAG: hypothetical protein J6X59_00865 [Bacteroidales bacterium]|nr:hypothetical protein [Bacteroidales bacterium]